MADNHQLILSTQHLLIVDDNQDFLNTLDVFFKGKGIQADVECGGPKGLETFMAHPNKYSVIVLDIQMPDMDGYEVAKRIRQHMGKRCPTIIAMSGNSGLVSLTDFDLYIRKPFKYEDLLRQISAIVGQKRDENGY